VHNKIYRPHRDLQILTEIIFDTVDFGEMKGKIIYRCRQFEQLRPTFLSATKRAFRLVFSCFSSVTEGST
jgi:hypothetical protein